MELEEYIKLLSKYSIDYVDKYVEQINSSLDYFDNNIPEHFTCSNNNIIYEFLSSIDVNIIKNELQKHGLNIVKVCDYNYAENLNKKWFTVTSKNDIRNDNEFLEILDKYNYNIKSVTNCNNEYIYILEPLLANESNKLIKKVFHNKLYHITTADNVQYILTHGLRPKYTRNDNITLYKKYKQKSNIKHNSRIYFVGITNKKQLIDIAKKIYNGNNDLAFLEIVLPDNISFYKDTTMEIDNCFYTFNSIPSKFITQIKWS